MSRGNMKYPQLHSETWLRRAHVEEGRSARDIAAELGCSPQGVNHGLKHFGLQQKSNGAWTTKRNPLQPATCECGDKCVPIEGNCLKCGKHVPVSDVTLPYVELDKVVDIELFKRDVEHSKHAHGMLSPKEHDVLVCVLDGHASGGVTRKDIALHLGFKNYNTVGTHTSNIRKKLGITASVSDIDLAHAAIERGWLTHEERQAA